MGRIRLQATITVLAIVLLLAAMGYVAFSVTTVIVPDFGGTYVEGIAGNPHAINPILCHANPVDRDLVALLFNGLTRASDRGEILPDLAHAWDISGDGTVYTFFLRDDVTWHDGAPFTADDVVFTINAIQNPDFQGVAFLSDMWRSVVVEKVDAYTVRFVLRQPFAPFLDYTTLGILPVHVLGSVPIATLGNSRFSASPIGTGPFKVAEVSARSLQLVANPDYYRPRSYLDRVEFLFYPDDPSAFEARRHGEVSGIARVLPEHLASVREDDSLTLYSAPLSGYNVVFLNLDRAIFQDPAIRQAMMWALDRQKLVDEVLGGQGIVIDSPILPNSWAYDTEVTHYQRDIEKAQVMLEEAGWYDDDGDGVRERGAMRLEFVLATNDDPTRIRLVEAISKQLADAGIRVVPQTVGWEELVSQMLRLRRFDAILGGWQNLPPDPDPYPYWHSSQATEDGLNYANYISREADDLLQDARSVTDREQRIELYRRFQQVYSRDMPSLLLYQPVYNYAVDASVRDVQIGPILDSSDRFKTVASWYIATQRMLYSEAREKGLAGQTR
ncbi:MAG: ABC transporter substrate-binding protein [Anaerolineae bacterium]